MVKLTFLKRVEIEGVQHNIYLDKVAMHFIAIPLNRVAVMKGDVDVKGDIEIDLSFWLSYDSYEALVKTTTRVLRQEQKMVREPLDPEEKHWNDVATFQERFSGD